MDDYGMWYCFWHTAKLKLYKPFIRFRKISASYGKTTFTLEVADSVRKRQLGLSFRQQLPPNAGMLLSYPASERHLIWTLNMRMPTDMLWLDQDGTIVYIMENVPRSYSWRDFKMYQPYPSSMYVLELAAGSVKEYRIREGNRFVLQSSANAQAKKAEAANAPTKAPVGTPAHKPSKPIPRRPRAANPKKAKKAVKPVTKKRVKRPRRRREARTRKARNTRRRGRAAKGRA
ncbi:MAG: DUF192 domain-containing protein [Candidatus Micrarchaeota archaeon]|nr:DUF192 domain-containing protein [Candidatus Micrarchaeota archaeon]